MAIWWIRCSEWSLTRSFWKNKIRHYKSVGVSLLLLVFVFTALFAMRRFLLPQLLASGMIDANHWGILFITAAPWIGAVIVGGLGGFVLVVRGIFAKQTALQRATF